MDEVLIAGAGPTGLVLALWLTRQGIKVRIIDKSAGPGETSRAIGVQARTLELYRQLDLADRAVAAGHRNPTMNLWARGRRRARIELGEAGAGLTPYPFILVYPQDRHERLLVDRLAELGVAVERRTELLAFEERGGRVAARLRLPDGAEQDAEFAYLAGCDGARSTVRHALGVGFEGGTYRQVFYVADVAASGLEPAGEAHVALDDGDVAMVFPYGEEGRRRLIGTVRDERADSAETLGFDDVRHDALDRLGLRVHQLAWFSTYRVHHRVADAFRRGRVFLLGDAAHIHSPAGGQGMNTGILDAVNLAWKLADVLHGRAPDSLLDSYAAERQAFARKLVDTTDRLFTMAVGEGRLADFIKMHLFPAFAGLAYRIDEVRDYLFRTVSQTTLHYRHGALSEGSAGQVHGGDRLPWLAWPGGDNYGAGWIGWQVQVYGAAAPALRAWCAQRGLALREFDWQAGCEEAGFARDALYLVRPDMYVALATHDASPDALRRYLEARAYTWDR